MKPSFIVHPFAAVIVERRQRTTLEKEAEASHLATSYMEQVDSTLVEVDKLHNMASTSVGIVPIYLMVFTSSISRLSSWQLRLEGTPHRLRNLSNSRHSFSGPCSQRLSVLAKALKRTCDSLVTF